MRDSRLWNRINSVFIVLAIGRTASIHPSIGNADLGHSPLSPENSNFQDSSCTSFGIERCMYIYLSVTLMKYLSRRGIKSIIICRYIPPLKLIGLGFNGTSDKHYREILQSSKLCVQIK